MKVAHADDQQPTLVGLGDTQQIREIGPPTDERVAPAKQSKVDSLILGGIAIAVVLAAAALGMGVLSYASSPDAVAGPQGANRRPGRQRATRNPRRARAAGAGRGHRSCRSEGGNGAHGLAGPSRRHRGDWCSGAGRPGQPGRAARSSRARRHRELRCSRQSTRLWARASPPQRPVLRVSLRSEVVRRSRRRAFRTRASRCGPPTQRPPTGGGPSDR